MAKQTVTLLTDDLDGKKADRSIEFGLDGVNYTIDLSERNIGRLRKALDPYLAVATRARQSPAVTRRSAPPRSRAGTGRQDRAQNQAIREWAAANGYDVSERGRIPSAVVAAYGSRKPA